MRLLQSKKAQFGTNGMPKGINFSLAILTLAVGGLGMFGTMIGFEMPEIPAIIIYGITALAGLVLLIDGFITTSGALGSTMNLIPKSINRILGILVLGSGTILLLGTIGTIKAIPIPEIALNVVLILGGLILLLDTLVGVSYQ